ncbi:sirohydrochlorin chelatase [Nocardia sp. NPDC050717]|uniref:sirohydrochlorin chelatase n=1 Tax=Nocardia sp. NPDC050717 TaxID=3157221 RepID=UPI0033CE8D4B
MSRTLAPSRGAAPVPRGVGGPALIAVAHGSRDPRSAATMAAAVAEIAAARPDLTVRLAFLDLCAPSVDQVVDDLAARGHTDAIVVPLLLGSAFHARVDLPALLDQARHRHPRLRLTQADVLGADPRLITALHDRVIEAVAGAPGGGVGAEAGTAVGAIGPVDATGAASRATPTGASGPADAASIAATSAGEGTSAVSGTVPAGFAAGVPARGTGTLGIVVAAVGSRSAAANLRTATVARLLAEVTGARTEICFATVEPGIAAAVDRLRTRGARRIVVAPWFLAPGLLTDRLHAAAPDLRHADVIGAHAALTDVVLARYDSAFGAELELSA